MTTYMWNRLYTSEADSFPVVNNIPDFYDPKYVLLCNKTRLGSNRGHVEADTVLM
jgi:hypothetical protein